MGWILLCAALVGGGDLEDLRRHWVFDWTCDAATGRHTLRAPNLVVAFVPGFDTAVVNGRLTKLSAPVVLEGGRVRVPPEIVALVEKHGAGEIPAAAAPPPPPAAPPAPRVAARRIPPCTIAIDAGHGGIHTGYKGRFLLEKDINLDVALEVQRLLESWGATVVMTRTDDRHFSTDIDEDLAARVNIVNRSRADLFISVHANGVGNAAVRGFEVWVPLSRDARGIASRQMAELVLGELAGIWSSENRGIKDDHNLRVLKGTRCPAVLVELEFVSNPAAERELALASTRQRLALAIAEAARQWMLRRR